MDSGAHQDTLGAKQLEEALCLANLWNLDIVRARIDDAYQTTTISPWETLRFGRRFHDWSWMAEGYAYLLCAPEPPPVADGEAMGWDTYYNILRLREKRTSDTTRLQWQSRVPISTLRVHHANLLNDIHELFSVDFLKAGNANAVRPPT